MPIAITTVWLGVAIVAGTIAVTIVGVSLVRRIVPRERLAENHEVVAVIFSMVGVLYAILLAFVVVVVWEQFDTAQQDADNEATKISNLMRDAVAFGPERQQIQGRLIAYTRSVVDDEWKTMAHGESSEVTAHKYRNVWRAYYAYQPRTTNEKAFYNDSLTRLNDLGAARPTDVARQRAAERLALAQRRDIRSQERIA